MTAQYISKCNIHEKIANVLSVNVERCWLHTKHNSFALWLSIQQVCEIPKPPSDKQDWKHYNETWLYKILETILSCENMNLGHNSRLNYITRTFSAGYRAEQEQRANYHLGVCEVEQLVPNNLICFCVKKSLCRSIYRTTATTPECIYPLAV